MEDIGSIVAMLKERFGPGSMTSSSEGRKVLCERCHDTGWIDVQEDGFRAVVKCSCRLAREAEQRLKASGLESAVKEQTFDSFQVHNEIQSRMLTKARQYVELLLTSKDSPRRPWLFIGGNPGSGKTHICTAVCGEILKHNISVRYMQWLNEVRKLKAVVNDDNFEDMVADYINVSVLYIDDLLKQKYTKNPVFSEADIKVAFTILNARYIMNKPTIISTEWNLMDNLLDADEGVFSRVYERCKGFTVNIPRSPENNYRLAGWDDPVPEADFPQRDYSDVPQQMLEDLAAEMKEEKKNGIPE